MEVTLLGIVMEVSLLQFLKAEKPIEVTLFGNVIEDNAVHPQYLQLIVYQQI